MNTLRRYVLALGLVGALLAAPFTARAAEREISGELVILNPGGRQFRIVDHGGSFTAPSGIALEDFDGKPVRVELGSGGRVLSITERHIETNPMMRHYQIVSGQLLVSSLSAGSFTIAGDGRPFVAPVGFDLRPYANQMVDVFLDEQGQVKSIDRSKSSSLPAGYPPPAMLSGSCAYDGQSYADGTLQCQSGTRYRCENGVWRSIGGDCAARTDQPCMQDGATYSDGSTRCDRGSQLVCNDGVWRNLGTACVSDVTTASNRARGCIVGDATVATGSTICRGGSTYRCSDGAWDDLGTACR